MKLMEVLTFHGAEKAPIMSYRASRNIIGKRFLVRWSKGLAEIVTDEDSVIAVGLRPDSDKDEGKV